MKERENDNLAKLIEQGNSLLDEHIKKYGYLRGFKRPILSLLQNELDGGDEREVNAFEINEYKLPR